MVPTRIHDFPWQPEDFDSLIPVGDYSTDKLNISYSNSGLGVATVAIHCRNPQEPFRKQQQAFSATVILRPVVPVEATCDSKFVLELFNPLRLSSVDVAGVNVPLRRDLTAPIAYEIENNKPNDFKAFVQPGSTTNNDGLFMIEPYQSGKIPIVLIHGLLSDPFTWVNIANEIRARPELMDRYQIWGFEYATGEPFLLYRRIVAASNAGSAGSV